MPTDGQILVAETGTAPVEYEVPNAQEFELLAVAADMDGSGAASSWIPAVVIESDGGKVVARAADPANVVAAGGSAEVSWFPGVKNVSGGGGGGSGTAPSVA